MSVVPALNRHPLLVFFGLAYVLSWWPALFTNGGLFPFGPLLAAVMITFVAGGKTGLRSWWNTVTRWRGGAIWYTAAIGLPVTMNLTAACLAVLLGAPSPPAEQIAQWPHVFLVFALYFVALGPLGEEPGWRGLAMPKLQHRYNSPAIASLALGVGVAVWHLPLVVGGQVPAITLVAIIAAQIIYTWLANQVDGRVLIVMIAHAAQGGLAGEYFGPMFTGAAATLETRLLVAIHCGVAGAIVVWTGHGLSHRRRPSRSSGHLGLAARAGE